MSESIHADLAYREGGLFLDFNDFRLQLQCVPHGSRDSCAISSVIAQQEGLAQAQIIDALRQIPLFNQINGAGIPAGDHGEPDVEALLQLSRKPHQQGEILILRNDGPVAGEVGAKPIQAYVLEQKELCHRGKDLLFLFVKDSLSEIAQVDHQHHIMALARPPGGFVQQPDGGQLRLEADIRILHHFGYLAGHGQAEQNRLLTGLTRLCGIGFQVLDAGVGQKINPRMLREHADDGGIGAHALGHDHKGAAGNLLDYAGAGVQVPAQSVHVNTHSGVHGLRTRSFLCSAVGAVEAGTAAALMAAIPCFRLVLPVGAHIIAHGLALLNVPL